MDLSSGEALLYKIASERPQTDTDAPSFPWTANEAGLAARVFGVAELRAAIFDHMGQRDLFAAIRVSRAWALTGIEALWRRPAPHAFGALSPDRRHLYAPAIETLTLTQHASEDFRGLAFPRVTRLNIHFAIGNKPAVIGDVLDRCGAKLDTVYLTATTDDDNAWDEVGDGVDGCDEYFTRHYSDHLDTQVLLLLAQRRRLTQLTLRKCIVDSSSIEHVRTNVQAPFADLKRLVAHVDAGDAHALVALLHAPALDELAIFMSPGGDGPSVTQVVAQHQPQLAQLQLWFPPNQCCTSDADLFALHRLHASLTALSVHDAYLSIDDAADWRAWLLGLPQLARLDLAGCPALLPADAWVVAGECCPRLAYLDLYPPSDLDALERMRASASTSLPLFPELQVLRLRPMRTLLDA
jgi:hypothetical protein